jgi:hypothetical protein
MRTFFPYEFLPESGILLSPEVLEISEIFREINKIAPLRKKRGGMRPYYELVVDGKHLPAEKAEKLWQYVTEFAFTSLTIPDNFYETDNPEQYEALFWEAVERGQWLRLSEDQFKKSVIADEEICSYVKKFGMFNPQGDRRPCFVAKERSDLLICD